MNTAPTVHRSVQRLRLGVGRIAVPWDAGLWRLVACRVFAPVPSVLLAGASLGLCFSGVRAWAGRLRSPIGVLPEMTRACAGCARTLWRFAVTLGGGMDLQRAVVLRVMSGRRRVAWQWVASSHDNPAWPVFRRALGIARGSNALGAGEHPHAWQGIVVL